MAVLKCSFIDNSNWSCDMYLTNSNRQTVNKAYKLVISIYELLICRSICTACTNYSQSTQNVNVYKSFNIVSSFHILVTKISSEPCGLQELLCSLVSKENVLKNK